MSISWAQEHWTTLEAFQAHLAKYDPDQVAAWAKGVTVHHTWSPTVAQWRGAKTMQGLKDFYASKGWSGAPHLFIAPDGIYQANPLNETGIHAGDCNRTMWGMEVVGNYDLNFWEEPIRSLAYGAITSLLRWRGVELVKGHRECLDNKSCPGNAVNMTLLRANIRAQMLGGNLVVATGFNGESSFIGISEASSKKVRDKLKSLHPIKPYFGEKSYQDGDIDYIIDAYESTCRNVGLNWVLCVAQSIHETDWMRSWWAARPRRNAAGVGVTGATPLQTEPANSLGWYHDPATNLWKAGYVYSDWKDSVNAHVGHLLNYIYKDEEMNPAQLALSNLSPRKKLLSADRRGCAKQVNQLNGKWAVPGTRYGERIASVANSLV